MRKFILIAMSSFFFASTAFAENDTCMTTLGKIPAVPDGTDQQKLDACVQWLFSKVKTGSHGKLIGMYRPGVELIKWQSGREWTYGQCYVHKGDVLFTLFTTSPVDSRPGEQNKACAAQTPIWTMLGDVIARD